MIARYQLLEHLGTTADAHLYRARYVDSGKPAMLKRFDPANVSAIPPPISGMNTRCSNRSILPALLKADLIQEGEHLTMALDDFAGESLKSVLGGSVRMDLPICLSIAGQLPQTLAGVHDVVPHADLPAALCRERSLGVDALPYCPPSAAAACAISPDVPPIWRTL